MNTLISQRSTPCPAIALRKRFNFIRTLACALFLTLSLSQSHAAGTLRFNSLPNVDVSYGTPSYSVSVTGISYTAAPSPPPPSKATLNYYDFRTMTLIAKTRSTTAWWKQTTGLGAKEFEAKFEIYYDGDGDGWSFVYGTPSQIENWLKAVEIEDGGPAISAGADMYGTDRVWVRQGSGNRTFTDSGGFPSKAWLSVTIKVSGSTLSIEHQHGGGSTKRASMDLSGYSPGSDWQFYFGGRNGADYGEIQLRNISIVSNDPPETPTPAPPAPIPTLSMSVSSSDPSVFQAQQITYTGAGSSGSFVLIPQDKAEGGSATISVSISATDGAQDSKSFTATLKPAPKPSLNNLTDVIHQEGVRTNRTYTVDITGLSDGDERRERSLTITASSSNPNFVANPTVNYASPADRGSLSVTVAPGPYPLGRTQPTASGTETATITVFVKIGDLPSISKTFRVTGYNAPVPTLDAIGDQRIAEDAQGQVITLTGINDGDARRDPELVVKAVSDNPILLPNPRIEYRFGNSTAALAFTPSYNQSGSANISVTIAPPPETYPEHYTNAVVSRTFKVTVTPTPDPVVAGAAGGVRFDGFDDRVEVPRLASIALGGEATFEFWQRVTRAPQAGDFTFKLAAELDPGGPEAFYSQAYVRTNLVEAVTPGVRGKVEWNYGSSRSEMDYGNLNGLLNVWTHWAFVVSTNDNALRIYRDGVLQSEQSGATPLGSTRYTTGSGTATKVVFAPYKLVLGAFRGELAEFRIWNLARSEGEIRQNKDKPLAGNESGLMVYHRFLDGTGLIVTDDASGETQAGSQPGVLVKGTSWVSANDLQLVNLTEGALRFVQTVSEGSLTNSIVFPAFDADVLNADNYGTSEAPRADVLTFAVNTNGLHGRLVGRPETGTWLYTPGPQFSGRETIPYTVTDTQGYSTSGTIQLVVLTRNDPPLISGIPDQTIFESGTVVVPFSVSDPDSPAELAKVTVFSSDRTVLRESGLTLRQYGTNWTLTLRPTAGESGFSKVRLTAFDGQDSSTREFEVQVQPRPMFQVLDLGELLGKPFTWAAAINDRGQVVGWAANDNAGGGVRGFFYDGLEQGGRMFQIPTLDTSGGGFNRAYGINLDGDVTGVASFSDVSRYHAFKWHFGELLATDLGAAPGGELSGGFAINSLGDVAGYGMTSGRTSPAAFWRDAQWHRINSLAAPFNGTNVAFAVNDSGLVVGVSYGSGGRRAFYFNAVGGTEPSPLGLLAGVPGGVHTNTSANAVNNGGSIAGVYSTIKMPYGRILELDGRTGQLASSGGPLDLTNQTFTIELWFRRSGARGAEALLSQGAELQLGFDAANQLYARCAGSDFFGPALIDSKWHHVALVLDGPAAERRLYLDGVPVTRETVVETHSSQGPMTLGAGVGERFQGAIDDLRIWKIARSLVEIRRGQYGWGINLNSDPNLLARWQFDAAHDDRNYAVSASGVYTTDVYAPIGSSPASRGSTNTFRLGFESTRLGGGAGGLNAGATNVALIGNRLYVAEGSAGVEFFDRSESGGLVRVGGFDTAGSALAVAATTNRLFVADGDNGLVILDLTSPGSPSVLATYKSTNGPVAAVKLSGGLAIITLTNSLEVVDVSGFVTQLYSTNLVDLLAPTDQATFLAAGGGNAAELIDNRNPTWAAGVFATNLESGLLVTVTNPAAVTALRLRAATATTIVTGLKFTSANDAPERDPTSYLLSGSDDGVNFRTISSSSVPAFTARGQVQSVSFPNTLAYTFYKLTFPTVANPSLANSMQIAEVELIRAGGDVTLPGDTVVPTSSDSPAGERVANVIDNNLATKYLNLAKLNTGFTVTPAADPTVVTGLSLTSASDAPERDPASYTLSGSNDGVNFTTISSGPITAFTARGQVRSVSFTNTTAFTSYKLAFPTVANPSLANGMQIAEVELIGTFDISRPSDAILATSDRSPAGEDGYKVIDNNPATKYLNFDKFNAGFTIIPTPLGSATMGRIRSFSLYGNKTTNAAEFVLLARGEFPEVSAGATAFVPVSTLGGYTYYKLVVNSLYGTGATRFALSELELLTSQVTPLPASPPARLATVPLVFGQILASVPPPAPADVTRPGNTVVATSSNSPGGEGAANVIDNNSATKYLNLDKLNTGFTVTPAGGLTIVTGLKLTSANDAPERDPASYALSGSLDGVGFTPIASGSLRPFTGRGQTDEISFTNTVAYSRYKLIFPTVLNAATANSMQIAEVELIGVSTTFSASVLSPSGTGWAGDTSVGPDKRAWSAGGIPDSQSRSMETSVTGPGTASFLWKVSSERNYDFLTVFLDGTEQEKISGEVDWTLKSIAIASGSHTLRWTYSKDGNAVGGSDRGWVANVEMRSAGSVATSLIAQPASADLQVAGNLAFVTSGTNLLQIVSLDTNRPAVTITSDPIRLNLFPLPQITQQPVSVTNNPGGSATFRVAASGDNPQYQWLKAGQTLTGATGPTLTLTNLSSGDGTNYSVRITNAGGAVTSSNAVLTVAGVTVGGGTAGQAGTQISTEPLGQAVDAVAANFAGILAPTGTGWAADTSLGSDKRGFSAGGLPDSQSRSMQVSVTGPGLVNFIWKVSSEARYDFLTVELDGVNQAGISGEVGWETKSISIPTGTHTLRWTYAKDGSVTSGADRGWVVNIDLQPVGASRPTADRLQSWSTGGNADWVSQTAVTHDTVDAAASGGISHSQSSWMETSVYGPGAFSFWWKVSSESSYDYLRLIVDGRERESISGDVNWTQRTLNLDAGRHTVRWAYTKDHSVVSGADKGYVDQVEFLPVGGLAITEQPAGQSYVLGQRVTLRSAVSGSVSSYTLVRGSSTWAQARTNAAAQGGYLATITSDAEWVEITRQVTVSDLFAARAWLGATDEQSEGTWKWITGEPFSYSRWNGGEPNNLRTSSSDGEDYLHINSGDGRWNDLSRAEFSQGYLMERAVVTYQWRRDGIDLAGATNALLTLTNAQLADAGAYTMLVRDSSGLSAVSAPAILAMQPASGASATTVGASGLGIEVRVFNDNRYVDTSAGANGEYANVVSSLNSLGFRPIGFFGTNFGGARVVVVPKLEKGAPSLTASERQAWASYVTQGGSLIVMHETAGKWLNSFLGTRLDTGSLSGAFNRGLAVIGTEYADDVSSLQALGVSRPLTSSSLATEARRIYEQSNQAIVADFFVGKGRVTYLGVEWSNMVPLGMQDGGWLEVLRSAVLESARRRGEERLVLAGLTVPGSVAPGTTVTLRASVAAVGPVTYQWLRDGVAIAGATNTIYSVTAQAGATNAYTVRVSSVAGPGAYESFALSSSPASLTVAGNRVYVAQGASGVEVLDISNPALVKRLGSFTSIGARSVDVFPVSGRLYAFVANGATGVEAWDITDLGAARKLGSRDDGTAQSLIAGGEGAYVSDPSGLQQVAVRSVPAILQHPATLTRNWGQVAEFRVVAEGSSPLRYQWRKNGASIPGATGATFTLASVTPQDAGWYQVEVSNNYTVLEDDKALSTGAGLTVRAFPRWEVPASGVAPRDVQTVPIKRAFIYRTPQSGVDLEDLGGLEANGDTEAFGVNDFDQVVGTATRGGLDRAMLVMAGETFDLNDTLPEENAWALERANAINSRGEIVGVGRLNGQPRAFLLVPATIIGKKVVRPLGALAGGQPVPDILKGNDQNEPPTSFFSWSDATAKLYAVRPGIAKLSWPVSPNAEDTNRVYSLVANIWPRTVTKHIAGAPVEIEPRGVGFAFSFQELHYPVGGAGVTLDTSAKIFNATTVAPAFGQGATNEVLRNQAYTVLRYLKNDGSDPDPKRQTPHFEIVRTYRYDDPRVRVP
ncbi:MAG: immunoglobulin domain-containing protein, partial [Verrucomicrobia bacterium]|nr:immunoglobulin domain-containing protein [Verrucomicrobiota bacterium]